jgi:hypothetical protein
VICPPREGHQYRVYDSLENYWRCVYSAAGVRSGAGCQRDYHSQIDVGHLDEEPPPSNSTSLMTIQEIFEHDSVANTMLIEDVKEEEQEEHTVFSGVPPKVVQLLHDVGFNKSKLTVTSIEMKLAWDNAVDMKYLVKIDHRYGCDLTNMARRGCLIRTIRPLVFNIVERCGLRVVTGRLKYQKGETRLVTYTLQ